MVTEINIQQNILDILSRYPNYMKNKWCKHALEHKWKNSVYPDFADSVEFASPMASDSCDPVYGSSNKSLTLHGRVEVIIVWMAPSCLIRQWSLIHRCLVAHGVTPSMAVGSSVNGQGAKMKPCTLYGQLHGLQQCGNFNRLSPNAHLDVVRSHKLCSECFRDNPSACACFKNLCSVLNCKTKAFWVTKLLMKCRVNIQLIVLM